MLSIASGVMMFGPLVGSAHAGVTINCGSSTTTVVSSTSINNLFASQMVISTNKTGGNSTIGNIGGGDIRTGRARSSATLSLLGNTNSTIIGLTGGGSSNTCTVVNTGN